MVSVVGSWLQPLTQGIQVLTEATLFSASLVVADASSGTWLSSHPSFSPSFLPFFLLPFHPTPCLLLFLHSFLLSSLLLPTNI